MSPVAVAAPVLVDTSVWIDHLRSGNAALARRLEEGAVWTHPFVVGELACGTLVNRGEILRRLEDLPRADPVEHHEALRFLDASGLPGRGIGWVDTHLLAAARLARLDLWTLDKRLAAIARDLGLAP